MPSEFIWITLFIAPDGDFIHCDKHNLDYPMIVRPMVELENMTEESHARHNFYNKVYGRQTLKIPCSEMEGQRIGTWPCDAWDNFLRGLIKDLESKGEAPWKK